MVKTKTPYIAMLIAIIFIFLKVVFDLNQAVEPGEGFMQGNYSNDLLGGFWPYYEFMRRSMLTGDFPFWSPYFAFGGPYIGDIQGALFFPTTWLIFIMPVVWAFFFAQLINIVTGMVGMYYLLNYLRIQPAFAIASSFIFGLIVFSGTFWPIIGSAFSVLPFVMVFTIKVLRKPNYKNTCCLAISLAYTFCAGHPNVFLYTGLLVFWYSFFSVLQSFVNSDIQNGLNKIKVLIIAFLLMLGLMCVQFLPTSELTELSSRVSKEANAIDGSMFSNFSSALMLKNFVSPEHSYLWSNPLLDLKGGHYFLGVLIFLIPFALLEQKFRKEVYAILFTIGFFTLLNIANEFKPLQLLFEFPYLQKLRWHTRSIDHIQFLLLILGTLGASNLIKSSKPFQHKVLLALSLLLAIVSFIFTKTPWLLVSLFLLSILVVYPLGTEKQKQFALVAFAVLLCANMTIHRQYAFPTPLFNQDYNSEYDKPVADYKATGNFERIIVYPRKNTSPATIANLAAKYSVPTISSYSSFSPLRWENLLKSILGEQKFNAMKKESLLHSFQGVITPKVMNRFINNKHLAGLISVRYVINQNLELVELEDYRPKAYTVQNYLLSNNEQESLQLINENLVALQNTVVVENYTPDFEATKSSVLKAATILSYSNSEVVVEVDNPYPSILVLSDLFYEGWSAVINGEESEVFRANSMFRGVDVPAGKQQIVFRFTHKAFLWGAGISIFTILFMLVLYRLRAIVFSPVKS